MNYQASEDRLIDINSLTADGMEFSPSQKLLAGIRRNKIEGFLFGLFFTFLSILVSIFTSNIFYLILAIILFLLSFSSVGIVYIHSELKFSQRYIINREGIAIIRDKELYFYHPYDALESSIIVHTVKGNMDYYSIFFLPVGLSIKLPKNTDKISIERLSKLLKKNRKNGINMVKLKVLKRYYFFPYLDLDLAIKIRNVYIQMYERWLDPFKHIV